MVQLLGNLPVLQGIAACSSGSSSNPLQGRLIAVTTVQPNQLSIWGVWL